MNTSLGSSVLSILLIIIFALLVFFVSNTRNKNRLSPLAGLAFGFILAGIYFRDNRYLGYGLIAVGVILAVIDIFSRPKAK